MPEFLWAKVGGMPELLGAWGGYVELLWARGGGMPELLGA